MKKSLKSLNRNIMFNKSRFERFLLTMKKNRSSISKAQSCKELGEYWDKHNLAEHWEETEPVRFEVDIKSETTYYAVDSDLSEKVQAHAKRRGISPDALLNLWLKEKLQEQNT